MKKTDHLEEAIQEAMKKVPDLAKKVPEVIFSILKDNHSSEIKKSEITILSRELIELQVNLDK